MSLVLAQAILGKLQVDHAAGVIRGVPVITAGEVPAPGAGEPFVVDGVLLKQIADAINGKPDGIRSRVTHPELAGEDGITYTVGCIRNARIEEGRVFADFHVGSYAEHSPQGNMRAFIFGLAEESPTAIGLSIVSESGEYQVGPDGMLLYRLNSLNSIDWVGTPAANPNGLLSKSTAGGTSSPAQPAANNKEGKAMNLKQKAYAASLGLSPDASDEDTSKFLAEMTPEQQAEMDKLKDEEAPAAASVATPTSAPAATPAPAAASASATPAVALSADDQKAVLADRARYREINDIATQAGLDGAFVSECYLGGKSADETRKLALAKVAATRKPIAMSSVTVGADLNRDTIQQGVQDAILLRAGGRLIKHDADGHVALSADGSRKVEFRKAHDRANDFRNLSLLEIGRRYLVALGYRDADKLTRPALAKLLMSRSALAALPGYVYLTHATGDFPEILADSMGKSLRAAYVLAQPTWRAWCRQTTTPDFKAIKRLQLSEAADLAAIAEGEEYTYGTLTESKETYTLGKFGKGIKFTREMLINDDLSAFDRVPRLMGNAAVRLEETTAYAILTANANLSDSVALFASGHSNTTTGALTVASLGAARAKMAAQTALGSSDPLGLQPATLIVPVAIQTTAEQLIASSVDPAKSNATPNPFSGKLQVVANARLDSTSAVQWYLAASFNEIDTVEMAFLEGEEGPTIEEEDEFDSDCRKIKIRHHVAAKAIDYRGLVRSSGS